MSHLFLASEIHLSAQHIANNLPKNVTGRKTAFIMTAAEPEPNHEQWVDENRQGMIGAGFELFEYTLTDKTPEDLEKDLGDVDIIHVNGGNTFWLLLQARKSGFGEFVKKHLAAGKVYMGSSAGSIVASPNIDIVQVIERANYQDELKDFTGLNLVDFIIMPHWGTPGWRAEYRKERLEKAFKQENKIILLNDYQYVHVGDGMYKIVDGRTD